MTSQFSSPPPPACISRDEYHAADPARQRLAPRSRFPAFLSLPNLKSKSITTPSILSAERNETPVAVTGSDLDGDSQRLITLDSTILDKTDLEQTDKYEWAVIFENQRGMTIFSTPYYSRLSLLPNDPPPFTLPSTSTKRSEQRSTTLDSYSLPDGNWKWVSKCWMIDMRSDTGEVQHDGFEYNWMFRTHGWSADVGALSAGGWVRRRRWIRLMMRPAPKNMSVAHNDASGSASLSTKSGWRHSTASSTSLPTQVPHSELLAHLLDMNALWTKDDVEGNWSKCRSLMKYIGRDGRKIELWKAWLAHYHVDGKHAFDGLDKRGKTRQKQWTEDDIPMPSEIAPSQPSTESLEQLRAPPKDYLIAVLREHCKELLHLFVYPESRATFLTMLGVVALLPEVNVGLGIRPGGSEMDFWSYTSYTL